MQPGIETHRCAWSDCLGGEMPRQHIRKEGEVDFPSWRGVTDHRDGATTDLAKTCQNKVTQPCPWYHFIFTLHHIIPHLSLSHVMSDPIASNSILSNRSACYPTLSGHTTSYHTVSSHVISYWYLYQHISTPLGSSRKKQRHRVDPTSITEARWDTVNAHQVMSSVCRRFLIQFSVARDFALNYGYYTFSIAWWASLNKACFARNKKLTILTSQMKCGVVFRFPEIPVIHRCLKICRGPATWNLRCCYLRCG